MNIQRISNPSSADYENAIVNSQPLIITEYFQSWPAMSKWSLDYLAESVGSTSVTVDGDVGTINEYVALVKDSQPVYMHQVSIPKVVPTLMKDIGLPEYFVKQDRLASRFIPNTLHYPEGSFELFIGGPGAGFSKLHFDLFHFGATIVQIQGHKDFCLFSPDDSEHLYVNPTHPHLSDIDNAFNPNVSEYPKVSNAKPILFTLKPGEGIFIPNGWWHATKFDEVNISVAFNNLSKYDWPLFANDFLREAKKSDSAVYLIQKLRITLANILMSLSGR